MKMSFKNLVAACFLIGGTFLMLFLGAWQLERLEWKKSIIHELDRQYSASNQPLYSFNNLIQADQEGSHILYGHLKGTPLWGKQIFYGPKSKDREMGFHVITPLKIGANQYALVNRGWISDEDGNALDSSLSTRPLMFTGLIRKPDWNRFTPDNSPENNIWTKLDIEQIADAMDLDSVIPFILYADKVSKEIDAVQPLEEKWYPRNKHAQYATFWFSMAIFFVGFFIFYAMRSKKN